MINNDENSKIIAYYGCPPRDEINRLKKLYPTYDWIDLDIDYGNSDSGLIPKAYCRIIRNIIDNAVNLGDRMAVILAATGADKCDGGRYAAFLLREYGFNVIEVTNEKITSCSIPSNISFPISTSSLPLIVKINKIMDTVLTPSDEDLKHVEPTHGFWGVPPNDFDLLRLFPDTTHVFGWARCVEAGRPADIDLECFVLETIPTVFYTQSFCAKSQLAKHLAEKYGGLYIDADHKIGMGIRARIEAFLELNK